MTTNGLNLMTYDLLYNWIQHVHSPGSIVGYWIFNYIIYAV